MSTNTRESDSSVRTEKESSSKEYLKYANHKYIGWLKHMKKTSLPKMHRSMMHYTPAGIILICVVNDKLVFYNFDPNTNKTHELANFSLTEYFHVGGEFIHYQSFLINSRYIYIIKNSFPTDEEHIFIFEIQSKKLLSIKNDETRPQTFRMNHSVTVSDLKFYFFGGLNANLECLNSMDVYNFETYKWEQITTKGKSPDPRHSHSSFIVGPNLYILGGTKSTDFFSKEGSFDDFFMLNLSNLTWTPIKMYGTPPKSLSYNYTFQLTKKYILFVSCDKGKDSCEINVKRFDINHYEWEDMELVSSTPEFRFGCGHCFDEETMTCFMFGGMSLLKVEAQSLTNEMDRIKISDQKDSFKSLEVLMVEKPSEVVVKNKDEPKSSERESLDADSESEEISFEELLEREKRLQEEEKTKVQPKKGKKKTQKKKSKTDNLD